jgi:Peptidase inhibitor family I36
MLTTKQVSKDLFVIPGVSDLNQESAAAVSGGALILYDGRNGTGARRTLISGDRNLGFPPGVSGFNNRASSYRVTIPSRWRVYTGINYTGASRIVSFAGTRNFLFPFNNTISSARRIA